MVILSSPVIATLSPNFLTSDSLVSPVNVKPLVLTVVFASTPFEYHLLLLEKDRQHNLLRLRHPHFSRAVSCNRNCS